MYPKDGKVMIEIYRGPPDRLGRMEEFKPSDITDEYWAEEKRIIEEMDKTGLMNTGPGPVPDAKIPGTSMSSLVSGFLTCLVGRVPYIVPDIEPETVRGIITKADAAQALKYIYIYIVLEK
jgi:hypothetical protein